MTDITPTIDQLQAISEISDWWQDFQSEPSNPCYVLGGYAGTGKSYCISYLAKSGLIKPRRIAFTAPTNKAAKVLRGYLTDAGLGDCSIGTIYSLLGLSLQANGEVKELSMPEEPVDLSRFDLIVVDEASMINKFLYEAVLQASADWSVPFLFMGDPAQLPPVGEITSPIWSIPGRSQLTKVLRYGSSMLDLATSIREVVDSPFPSVKIISAPPVHRVDRSEWNASALRDIELFKSGEAKIIAWRNITVDKYNTWLRGHIFGRVEALKQPWLPGDKIVATSMLVDLEGTVFMRTDEEATVLECLIGTHPLHTEYEIYRLLCVQDDGRKVTIRTLTPRGQRDLNNQLNTLSAQAKAGKKYLWRQFWQLKEAFNEIRHSYAITSHRSQGSSYTKVWIDLEDIMLNRNRQEAFRSLYVACTRQREEIWIA